MIRLKNILCPIDFSASSIHALNHAIDLSIKEQASIYLVHVIETHTNNIVDILKHIDLLLDDKHTENIRSEIINLIPEGMRTKLRIDAIVVKGVPFVEIVKIAKEKHADLIVMGTHGRTGLEHILLGSVAERVIQKAPCPVLSIRLQK